MLVLPELLSYDSVEREYGNTYLQIGLHHFFGFRTSMRKLFSYDKCGMRQPRLAQPYVHNSAERPLHGLLHSSIHTDLIRRVEPDAIV